MGACCGTAGEHERRPIACERATADTTNEPCCPVLATANTIVPRHGAVWGIEPRRSEAVMWVHCGQTEPERWRLARRVQLATGHDWRYFEDDPSGLGAVCRAGHRRYGWYRDQYTSRGDTVYPGCDSLAPTDVADQSIRLGGPVGSCQSTVCVHGSVDRCAKTGRVGEHRESTLSRRGPFDPGP
jgi:hypothetical protein